MNDINNLCLESIVSLKKAKEKLNIFSKNNINVNAKYTPPFLSKIKKIKPKSISLNLKKLFTINPKTIKGTDISIDANADEYAADQYMKKHGFLK